MVVPGSCLLKYKIEKKRKNFFDMMFDDFFY